MTRLRAKRRVNVTLSWRGRRAKTKSQTPTEQTTVQKRHWSGFFRWILDVSTLVASVATVATLLFFMHDRREQANIAAWTLLQGYLHQDHRAQFNEGQGFALETLARNGVNLSGLDAHDSFIYMTNLHGLDAASASFEHAELQGVDLSNAGLEGAHFEGATLFGCDCRGADFKLGNLRGASLSGDFRGASFSAADISDLEFPLGTTADEDVLKEACYRPGHAPTYPDDVHDDLYDMHIKPAVDPHGRWCMSLWGEEWARLKRRESK